MRVLYGYFPSTGLKRHYPSSWKTISSDSEKLTTANKNNDCDSRAVSNFSERSTLENSLQFDDSSSPAKRIICILATISYHEILYKKIYKFWSPKSCIHSSFLKRPLKRSYFGNLSKIFFLCERIKTCPRIPVKNRAIANCM
ncbi:unnamed protein product [Allacma fusca]|uniref:Uncharacterized protein n=1 Tax=Allacma fusca TaxID=39272 RepID=A0A8J2K4T5_9HEXA|nr:unnamed protein product [Allacma fusca]